MKITLKKTGIKEIYIYIILAMLFYTSGSVYNFVFYAFNVRIKLVLLLLIFLGITVFGKKEIYSFFLFAISGAVLFLWALLGNANMNNFFTSCIRILSVYFFVLYSEKKKTDLLQCLYRFTVCVAVVYLIAWLLFDNGPLSGTGNIISVMIEKNVEGEGMQRYTYTAFLNIYFRWKNVRKILNMDVYASNGPFWEPGLYQVYLNFALWYELFRKEKINCFTTAVLIVAILSTTSTTGILTLIVLLSGYLYGRRNAVERILLILPIGFIVIQLTLYVWYEKMSYSIMSIQERMADIFILADKWLQHPILGCGMGNTGGFNGLLLYCVDFGIVGLLFICFYLFKLLNRGNRSMACIMLCSWLVLSLFNEPIGYHSLFCMILILIYRTSGWKVTGTEKHDNNGSDKAIYKKSSEN